MVAWFYGDPWRIWVDLQLRGVIAVDDGELIWPTKVTRKQILVHVGERRQNEPALITCEGRCGNGEVAWTWHQYVRGSSYECRTCGKVRRWGLDLW